MIHLIAFLHDMLKPLYYKKRDGKDTYHNHNIINNKAKELLNNLYKDMVFSNKEKKFLEYVIQTHHLFKMMRIDNDKTVFNCAYQMRKNKEFLKAIKPILWGDFDNFDREGSIEDFNAKYDVLLTSIEKIDEIEKSFDWNEYSKGVKNKKNISKTIEKTLKKCYVNNVRFTVKQFKNMCGG